jgi:hypothetical protein
MDTNIEWLEHRVDQYRANKTDACEAIDDFDKLDKLGQRFTSVNPLEQVDIGDGSVPRLTFLFSHAGMRSGSPILCLLRRKIMGRSKFALILEI